jgi:glycosyltransferase involved in cell wall biosynthesis/acyl carrier protein
MIEERLQKVLRRVLNISDLTVEESTLAYTVPGWDSLKHVEILLEVQQEYSIHFRTTEVIRLKNVGDMQELINRKLIQHNVITNNLNNMHFISVIIPCKNEERYIRRCINSILNQGDVHDNCEVIVVDNGSTDKTVNILREFGTQIIFSICPDLTISGLRNYGAKMARTEWLAFVDADVEVDKYWLKHLQVFFSELGKEGTSIEKVVTGSTCCIPENPTWVEKVWFGQLTARNKGDNHYINSGNLIIHRKLFDEIGGFNTFYTTGEDVKLCSDALIKGGKIRKNEKIKATHWGYPRDVISFFHRERWHGLGMKEYFARPWNSMPLVLSLYFICLSIMFMFSLAMCKYLFYSTFLFFLFQFLPLWVMAIQRSKRNIPNSFLLAVLYLIYGWARACSVVDISLGRIERAKRCESR